MFTPAEFPETRLSLLNALRDGSESDGWRDFYRRYAPAVFRVARLRGLPEHDAEDIVQQVMLETARHIETFEYRAGRHKFRSWVRTIAENKIVDLHRRQQRTPPAVQHEGAIAECIDTAARLDEAWEREWKLQEVLWCIEQAALDISPRRMQAFQLYSLDGLPAEEVAHRLDMTVGYVYVTRCQVLNLVRKKMAALEDEAEELNAPETPDRRPSD